MAGAGYHLQTHFLDACFLCRMPLDNRDIYMYRGDIPFCSDECRSVQIDADEAAERAERASARRPAHGPSSARGVDGPQECGKIRAGSVLAL